MSTPIRLLVSDVDGTLVRPDKTLSEATVAAFVRLRDAGIAATLISGRPPSGMVRLAEALGIIHPLGAFNGGTIFTVDGTVLECAPLDAGAARAVLALETGPAVDVWVFASGHWYAHTVDNPRVPLERLSSGIEPTLVADFASIAARCDKITFVSEDGAALQRLARAAASAIGTEAAISRSQRYFLDISAPSANKGHGVEALARAIGIPLAEVVAIGDMPNDLPMFARAGLSIAMGQAPGDVRAAADQVTASDVEDGVAIAIDRLIRRHPRASGFTRTGAQ